MIVKVFQAMTGLENKESTLVGGNVYSSASFALGGAIVLTHPRSIAEE